MSATTFTAVVFLFRGRRTVLYSSACSINELCEFCGMHVLVLPLTELVVQHDVSAVAPLVALAWDAARERRPDRGGLSWKGQLRCAEFWLDAFRYRSHRTDHPSIETSCSGQAQNHGRIGVVPGPSPCPDDVDRLFEIQSYFLVHLLRWIHS